jgi:hypothetical protein
MRSQTGARRAGGATVISVGAVSAASPRRPLAQVGAAATALLVLVAGLLAGTGWLYVFRGLHWLAIGPRLGDALPLLQLAAADGQPLARVIVAWAIAGAIAGVALVELSASRRAAAGLVVGLVVLLVAAQASSALARNLNFSDLLFSHGPGLGPLVEAMVFAAGCALPRRLHREDRVASTRGPRRSLVSLVSGLGDRDLSGGENGNAGEDDGDRHQVRRGRAGARP